MSKGMNQWNTERDSYLTHLVHQLGTKKWAITVDKMK